MPTINEVWEQALLINANLGTLHNDQQDLKECCASTNTALQTTNTTLADIRTVLADGLTSVADGLAGIQARQDQTNRILAHQSRQLETVICALEHVSEHTCELVNQADEQVRLQRALRVATEGIEHMVASVNGEAAVALSRERAQRDALEACCPPAPPEPRCTYEPCRKPKDLSVDEPSGYEPFKASASRARGRRAPSARS